MAGGGNAKPERLEGSSVPAYVLDYRKQIMSDIERLAGTYDILNALVHSNGSLLVRVDANTQIVPQALSPDLPWV